MGLNGWLLAEAGWTLRCPYRLALDEVLGCCFPVPPKRRLREHGGRQHHHYQGGLHHRIVYSDQRHYVSNPLWWLMSGLRPLEHNLKSSHHEFTAPSASLGLAELGNVVECKCFVH